MPAWAHHLVLFGWVLDVPFRSYDGLLLGLTLCPGGSQWEVSDTQSLNIPWSSVLSLPRLCNMSRAFSQRKHFSAWMS